jgi:hypothetical protein
MNKLSVTLAIALFAVLAFFGGNYLGNRAVEQNTTEIPLTFGAANAPSNSAISTSSEAGIFGQDVVGTHQNSTTTIGVASTLATTTYVSKIGRGVETAIYMIKMVSVQSTTLNNLTVTVEGSNDLFCDTQAGPASSTTDVVKANINWFSAMDHLKDKVHATSFTNGSSTAVLAWANAAAGYGQEVILTNLAYECLRLGVSGVSTTPYIQLYTK